MEVCSSSEMVMGQDLLVGEVGELAALVIMGIEDGIQNVNLRCNFAPQQFQKVGSKGHVSIPMNEVAIIFGNRFTVDAEVFYADRQNGARGAEGSLKKRAAKGFYSISIGAGAFRE